MILLSLIFITKDGRETTRKRITFEFLNSYPVHKKKLPK